VNDSPIVRVRDGVRDRGNIGHQRESVGDGRPFGDERLEGAPGDELHCIERRSVGPTPGLVNRDDAGMLESGGD
jgi:hypothetical protein